MKNRFSNFALDVYALAEQSILGGISLSIRNKRNMFLANRKATSFIDFNWVTSQRSRFIDCENSRHLKALTIIIRVLRSANLS